MELPSIDIYLTDDTIFNAINRKFTSLNDDDIKQTNSYLTPFVTSLIDEMKMSDPTFRAANPRIGFVGSYYKGTRYGRPEEFDLNIILTLPIMYHRITIQYSSPGFIKIHSGLTAQDIHGHTAEVRLLRKILDQQMYINQRKFRQWLESVLSNTRRAIHKTRFKNNNNISARMTSKTVKQTAKQRNAEAQDSITFYIKNCKVMYRKGGPAFTFTVQHQNHNKINVDLVPVLEFQGRLYKTQQNLNNYIHKSWYAVPKPIRENGFEVKEQEWRLCFYDQECEILSKYGRMKPIIRQLKKLRDNQGWTILCSYYIESVCFNYIQQFHSKNPDKASFTAIFVQLLMYLQIILESHMLQWVWDRDFNLLGKFHPNQLKPIIGCLKRIIQDIKRNIHCDRFIIARSILNEVEMVTLRRSMKVTEQ